jgi:hypothetical protein
MITVTQPDEPRKNDPTEEQECIDLLLRHKATSLAATAWECYIRGGRGALLTNGTVTEYLPRGVIKRHPGLTSATRQQLRQASKTYNPRREVLLVIPWSNRQWTIRRVVTDPGPETAFLQRVGTDGLPPLQIVMCQPWHGHRSRAVGGGRDAGQ